MFLDIMIRVDNLISLSTHVVMFGCPETKTGCFNPPSYYKCEVPINLASRLAVKQAEVQTKDFSNQRKSQPC